MTHFCTDRAGNEEKVGAERRRNEGDLRDKGELTEESGWINGDGNHAR